MCVVETIAKYLFCNSEIRRQYIVPDVISARFSYNLPKYYYNCSNSYLWTKRALDTANELAILFIPS
ncbi:DUF2321 domain-containing protein [Tetragenococcus halophilus]|uniref:DUF2321 domain-containing protein n=1 Tax=Tetragenococcus halophilus TaxID=51669 RepID=UPI000CCC075F